MKFFYLFLFIFLVTTASFAQKTKVTGIVKDEITNEPIIGALVVYGEGKGSATDLDGMFTLALDSGKYTIKVSYLGYKPMQKVITAKGKSMDLDFILSSNEMSEVEVVSDVAIQRETPVAFSNVDAKKIAEELGSKDLPLILNSTPGVYATSVGGGDGDARISIRGFNSQNVLVLLDGIPMNDMVNGRVFWTNWFGLDNLTRTMQVQRGLGASKLAIPAIGGSINILTAGIDSKRAFVVKNEYGNNRNYRIGLSYSSGRLKNGWAFNFAGTYKRNDGWFDNMWSRMWFYYGKVEKKIGNHLIGLQVFGAPQTSAQRDFRVTYNVSAYNKDYAYELGVDTVGKRERGWRYNPSWNFLTRTEEGQTSPEVFTTSINKFHKPVLSLKDLFSIGEKITISTIAYASYGRGYGTQLDGGSAGNNLVSETGQQNIQGIYDANISPTQTISTGENFSSSWIRKNHNDHDWYGGLATFNYKVKPVLTLSGGIDGRLYKGYVYSTIGDLLGGDVVKSAGNPDRNKDNYNKVSGDRYVQNIERRVRWLGAFLTAEYKKNKWAGFVNASYAINMYKQFNYFLPKQLKKDGNVIDVPYGVVVNYNGTNYDNSSKELVYNQTNWKQLNAYTIKCGANYNLTEHMSVFANVGYLNRVPFITFVFNNANQEFKEVNNEKIKSAELGYNYISQKFNAKVNGYYTIWNNRPTSVSLVDPNDPAVTFNTTATGMSARHVGLEFDGSYKVLKNLELEGMANFGDWEWISEAFAATYADDGTLISEVRVDPRGVKVADAAQITYGAGFRYEPIKNLYIKPQFNYFGKNYANLDLNNYALSNVSLGAVDPELKNLGRQSWRMPDYYLIDFNCGYKLYVSKVKLDIRASVMNLLNRFYISDAQNNQLGSDFNASSSTVNVGMGRRWQLSLTATF